MILAMEISSNWFYIYFMKDFILLYNFEKKAKTDR